LLTRNITRYMGSVPSIWDWVVPVLAAASVFGVLVLFVLLLLRRFRGISAVAALRRGEPAALRGGTPAAAPLEAAGAPPARRHGRDRSLADLPAAVLRVR
jgi:hypothetical protein